MVIFLIRTDLKRIHYAFSELISFISYKHLIISPLRIDYEEKI